MGGGVMLEASTWSSLPGVQYTPEQALGTISSPKRQQRIRGVELLTTVFQHTYQAVIKLDSIMYPYWIVRCSIQCSGFPSGNQGLIQVTSGGRSKESRDIDVVKFLSE